MRAKAASFAMAALVGGFCATAAPSGAEARTERAQQQQQPTARQGAASRPAAAARSNGPASATAQHAVWVEAIDTAGRGGALRNGDAAAESWGRISCVPYARQVSGIELTGNAREWWGKAAGLYARGDRPEPGAILAFPASGNMSRGHVAVVSRVLGARELLVDHANWEGPGIRKGTVMRGVSVIDVSAANDWSAVRVQVGWERGSYGRPYPTHGFIYNRPDGEGAVTAAATGGRRRGGTAMALAGGAERYRVIGGGTRYQELAEMPDRVSPHASRHLDLSVRMLADPPAR